MAIFRMKLAGIPMQIHALFDTTTQFCHDYLTDECPLIDITVTRKDLTDERKRCAKDSETEEYASACYSDEYIETLALYRRILEKLLPYNVLLFHSSAIALNGNAYLFTAKSGVGKTTHTRLWLDNIPGCYVLNGDKPLLLFKDNAVYVCGTPWMGKENYGVNEILPLKAICILERNTKNSVEPVSFDNALASLASQAYCPFSGKQLVDFIRLISRLDSVGLYRLHCNMEAEAASVAYHAIAE